MNSGASRTQQVMPSLSAQQLLEDHSRMRDAKDRREAERKEKEAHRAHELRSARECDKQKPGYQRLRILQYDDMRRKLVSSHGTKLGRGEVSLCPWIKEQPCVSHCGQMACRCRVTLNAADGALFYKIRERHSYNQQPPQLWKRRQGLSLSKVQERVSRFQATNR